MAGKTTIYRVAVRWSSSYQGSGVTFWTWEDPMYCGVDETQARVAFYESEQTDHGGNPGSPCRETVMEELTD
mgnify:FL=1